MADLLFKNARVVDPSQKMNCICDVLCKDGLIAFIGQNIVCGSADEIDASGLILAPGLIDLHTHLRDPGFTEKEDILTGCSAAAAGGVTTLCAMPNTCPACDTPEIIRYVAKKAKNAKARVLPVAAITKGLKGEELTDMPALKEAGACAFSDDGVPVHTAAQMRQALAFSAELNVPIFAHTEDRSLSAGGIVNDCVLCADLGIKGIPNSAEDVGTAREIALLMSAPQNAKLHICHVSTAGSVALIRDAKARGLHITAETCPHYFIFTDAKLQEKDADYRMNPPLRSEEDRKAVLHGILDGTLDVIATDHAPHTAAEKADFFKAPNGVIGMETSFAASYTALVKSGVLSVSDLIDKMSVRPAQILGIDGGTLRVGTRADLILIDENAVWTVDTTKLHGKSKNCVFKNCKLQSKIKMTVSAGKIVYNDGIKEN
ncbi:MAG: dihydroorotase [Candidatus Fimenecus sp.]